MKKQKLKELHDGLQRWKSHNEVHAKASDKMLFEVIEGILNLLNEDTQAESKDETEAPVVNGSESFVAPAGDDDSSNPPGSGPATPP